MNKTERQSMIDLLELVNKYLHNPEVEAIPFALPVTQVSKCVAEVIEKLRRMEDEKL